MSKKYQLLMDKLIEGQVVITQTGVTTNPKSRRCYMQNYAEVTRSEMCERCRLRTPKVFLNCPEVLKEQGIGPKKSVNPSL